MNKATILALFGAGLVLLGVGITSYWLQTDCQITKTGQVQVGDKVKEVNRTISAGPLMCTQKSLVNMMSSILGPLFIFAGGSSLIGGIKAYLT